MNRTSPRIALSVASLLPLLTLAACGESSEAPGLPTETGPAPSATVTSPADTTSTAVAPVPAPPPDPNGTGGTGAAPVTPSPPNATTSDSTTSSAGSSTLTGSGGTGGVGDPTDSSGGAAGGTTTVESGTGTSTGTGDTGETTSSPPEEGAKWGQMENPSADCSVAAMPDVGSLSASSKLPDPFTKMDGSRITDKSEWRCRREEILQQAYEFIYGEKPVPKEGAVSGTVSNSSISIQVEEESGSTSFTASVAMNGATAPAPAIIVYGGLSTLPVPSGVATITLNAIETQGGSGAKSGPFYDVYGANHPAGYLAAQAWQVSRIIDVLEQDPSLIDPTKVGVTGCSRLGKGAFVAGVLDNRIALTIPVESGLGGTVGLRLVEVIDSYSGSEWPYHAISYVRWLSEVALGPFTTGNNAGADNTDKLPIDMHEMMGLIAPRGLYIVDNPSTMYNGLDRNSAWVTAKVGQLIFEALGVGDHMAYEGASGSHCAWRQQYTPSLEAMVDKFLKGNGSADTGAFKTDLPNPPNPSDHHDWDAPTLSGEL